MGRTLCRTWHHGALASAMMLAGFSTPSPAPAQSPVFSSQFSGLMAEASFSGYDPSTESWTEVNVYALDGRRRFGKGQPEPTSSLWVQVAKIDPQSGFRWLDGFASIDLPAPAFQPDPGLGQATLTATVQLYDFSSGTKLPLTLELTWTGAGERYHSLDRSRFQGEGYLFHYRHLGLSRNATAGGAFSLGAAGAERLGPSAGAALSSVRDGYLELYR